MEPESKAGGWVSLLRKSSQEEPEGSKGNSLGPKRVNWPDL